MQLVTKYSRKKCARCMNTEIGKAEYSGAQRFSRIEIERAIADRHGYYHFCWDKMLRGMLEERDSIIPWLERLSTGEVYLTDEGIKEVKELLGRIKG